MRSGILKSLTVPPNGPLIMLMAMYIFLLGCKQTAEDTDLEERNGLLFQIGSQEPFTGVRTKHHKILDGTRKAFEIHYEKGLAKGQFKTFYPHGIKKQEGQHIVLNQKSVRDGVFTKWRKNGTLEYKKSYLNGELHGAFRLFHDKWPDEKRKTAEEPNQTVDDATDEYEVTYHHGIPEGSYNRYQINGSKLEEGSYSEGKFNGDQVHYFPQIEFLVIREPGKATYPKSFPANEDGLAKAVELAQSIHHSTLSRNPEELPTSVLGLADNKKFMAILWQTDQGDKPSWAELSKPRQKYRRTWENGQLSNVTWFDPQGTQVFSGKRDTAVISSP